MLFSYFILIIASSLFTKPLYAEWIECSIPSSIVLEGGNENIISIYDAKIKVQYTRHKLAVYTYTDTRAVNFLLNDSTVIFSGYVLNEDNKFDSTTIRNAKVLYSNIAGSAELTKRFDDSSTLSKCDTYLSRQINPREDDLTRKLQVEILHQAASCLRPVLCKKLGVITFEDFDNAGSHPFAFKSLAVSRKINAQDENSTLASAAQSRTNTIHGHVYGSHSVRVQNTINTLVDLALAEIIKIIQNENGGTIKIPDIKETFTQRSVWKPHGEFDAIDGYFSDLTTLSRSTDATISHKRLKFIASCGFDLLTANIHYNKYKVKYGISVSGELWATIDGVELYVSVAIDYNHKPCRVELQDLSVINLGQMNIELTGLGPFNSLLSKLATWITKKWKEDIVVLVEDNVRNVIIEHLDKIDCERFRP